MKYLFLCIFFFQAIFYSAGNVQAHVEDVYYLKGSLGKRELVMKIFSYDDTKTKYVTCFFTDEKKDRYLSGQLRDNTWEFVTLKQAGDAVEDISKEIFYISENEDHNWTGFAIDSKGDTAQVKLAPFTADSFVNKYKHLDYVKELDPFDSFRLSDITFSKSRTELKSKGLMYEWVRDMVSGIEFFRLKDSKGKINTDSINRVLETIHLSLIHKSNSFNPNRKSVKVSTDVLFFNGQLLSFQILRTSEFFTMATATRDRELKTLFVEGGKEVNLEDLIWFDEGATPAATGEDMYTYRQNKFAPKILGILKGIYPEKVDPSSCEYNLAETWQFPSWSLTKNGLALGSLVLNECDMFEWAVIPYSRLSPYWNKRFPMKKM